jgi:LPXTG-motif cell wall-anchored protein
MRNKIFGGIGILFGGALLFRRFTSDAPSGGTSAYQAGYEVGQSAAVIFGALMLLVGLYTFFRKSN